jgi:2-oxoglutarate ferredoxin oxidoreductase subunit alpha
LKDLKKAGIVLEGDYSNTYFAGRIFKILGLEFSLLDKKLKEIGKKYEENLSEAKKGYSEETRKIEIPKLKTKNLKFTHGNAGISEGAIKSGLDCYFAYPMTPATSVMMELAGKQLENNFVVIELENEIAVANAGVGSCITGAKAMVGTSGGGFDLMTETLSLCGIAQVPLVFFLSMRPGPATGVATYTGQGDLSMARYAGHGEFNRIIVCPGEPKEAEELTNQAFYLSQKFRTPSIIVSDKHLGESFYTLSSKPEIVKVPRGCKLGRYNSYEVDKFGSATEDSQIIKKNILERKNNFERLGKESKKFKTYKVYGNKSSKNVIVSFGSTKCAILDAIRGLDVKFIQILYIEPFDLNVVKEIKDKNLILIENSSSALIGDLIKEKTGIRIEDKNKILRFDGRPFLCDELKEEIKARLRR